jgi:hypothetical protein
MKILAALLMLVSLTIAIQAADQPAKPAIKVSVDGLPSGHDTPEGAACDLARAFIKHDSLLFTNTCIRLYAGGKGPAEYAAFLKATVDSMKKEGERQEGDPRGPKSIGKVFAARHLSKGGPSSYGYASFGFKDIMFVDVGVLLHGDKRVLNRTMVIKDKDGKWYVHPMPGVSPLLSEGLNDEDASKLDFTEAYEIQEQKPSKS